jgi:uncharacterized membrane protein
MEIPPEAVATPRRRLAQALWILGPFGFFLLVLQRLWTNAPVWDDYDAILALLLRADDIRTPGEWLAMVFAQHNEHRIAVMRLIALGVAGSFGQIDFRIMMLIANLSLLGTFLFVWREFRREVAAPIFGAAALVMFQWSYFEASLMGSAGPPHLGVVFFAFGCLYFALREGTAGFVLAAVFGVLAAASQANGLFALPIAAVGCVAWGGKRRAVVLGILAVLAWVLYLYGYVRPPGHPSPLVALTNPIPAVHLFCVVIGGILPGTRASAILGALILVGFAWMAWKGLWRTHPVAALWVTFLLATAATASVGRVGFGVHNASRYAIVSTSLLVILALCFFTMARPLGWKAIAVTLLGGVAISFGVTLLARDDIVAYALRGKLLRETVPAAPGVVVDRFAGAFYPNQDWARHVLTLASERGHYFPRKQLVYPTRVFSASSVPETQRRFGHVDVVAVSGRRVSVTGWSDITAQVPSRTMQVISSPQFLEAVSVAVIPRQDVTTAHKQPDLLLSGFLMELDYASESDARDAAKSLCMVVEAPDRPRTILLSLQPNCAS